MTLKRCFIAKNLCRPCGGMITPGAPVLTVFVHSPVFPSRSIDKTIFQLLGITDSCCEQCEVASEFSASWIQWDRKECLWVRLPYLEKWDIATDSIEVSQVYLRFARYIPPKQQKYVPSFLHESHETSTIVPFTWLLVPLKY